MIGFIGLGIMGQNMAANLLDKGEQLVVYNRTKEKAQTLLDKGAIWAASPREVGQQADIVFTMLTDPAAVQAVANGEDGLFSGMKENSLWVDVSTVKPAFTKEMAEAARAHHIRFVDAPVSGSKAPAQQGKLHFLVGGNDQDVKEITPLLEKMGQSIQHMGVNGNGSSTKLAVNMLLVQSLTGLSEAISFGEAVGLDREHLMDVLLALPVTSDIQAGKRDTILQQNFDPQFPLEHAYKDLQQISETAYEAGAPLPMTNSVKELYALAKKNGYGKQDVAAVYALLARD
ncbi:NAD(P)-dependent oxidoreductase [Terribacillus saccharophilus]|uniref:NAD(P)-dependent oxidoreductase n=1 Tax=Terribacillus saccharophilus TaxID=361277 RepID=UPI002DD26282|nr:NAD(P)-dependent oxidoreductase [Terribacillus saccharophilus]MEC0291384.1 NAD(P)-dependent oxidoreductase [Terribacillus saccharophilus]